jgi:hypothetical protein
VRRFGPKLQLAHDLALELKTTGVDAYFEAKAYNWVGPKLVQDDLKLEFRMRTVAASPMQKSEHQQAQSSSAEQVYYFMTIHSIPIVALAAVTLFVGLFFSSIYLRYKTDTISGSFALVCFAVLLYDIGCLGLYNSTDLTISARWQRIQFSAIALVTITLSIFYRQLTCNFSGKTITFITIINLGFIAAIYFLPGNMTLDPSNPAVKSVNFGDFLHIAYFENHPGFVLDLQLLVTMVIFTICILGLIKFQLNKGRSKLEVAVAMIIYYFAGINDSLVSLGVYSFLYLFEYAFAAMIVSMTITLVNDFLNLHEKAENMNVLLEKEVNQQGKELSILSGLLPICAACKKIRDDNGYWSQIEIYFEEHSDATFTHGICPECRKKLYPIIKKST